MLRNDVADYHSSYYRAMRNMGCLDELYPSRYAGCNVSNAELLEQVKQYKTIKELSEKNSVLYSRIRRRGIQKEAYAHMEPLGNRKHRMIYVYEFPDHSAYIGLTYNYRLRHNCHITSRRSTVYKYMATTGLTPIHKKLTDYIPVKEAKELEAYYIELYKSQGWTILNKAKAGGTGSRSLNKDMDKVISLAKQGLPVTEIAKVVEMHPSTICNYLSLAGIDRKKLMQIEIDMVDQDSNILRSFSNTSEASEALNLNKKALSLRIHRHIFKDGYYLIYNPEQYKLKKGVEFKVTPRPKNKQHITN